MQEQIDALKKEIEELNERIEELEAQLNDVSSDVSSIADGDALSKVENVLEFSFLDNVPECTNENIIILHSNPYRTYQLVNSCKSRRYNFHRMGKLYLTTGHFKEILSQAQKGDCVMLHSDVFDFSDEFETLILDAISQSKVYFFILTNDLEKVPQSIREKMRVIQ